MMSAPKGTRRVFVIMPFVQGGTRNEIQLKSFFEHNIKEPIERADLQYRYVVTRSGQTFDITTEIIRDLCRADMVIADLSGVNPNPNVMYELGVRLAISETPVILIRESHPDNKGTFDIIGFYTHSYDAKDLAPLERHLLEKIGRLESGEEPYTNRVLSLIREEMGRLNPGLTDLSPEAQRELVLRGIVAVATNVDGAYGPYGKGLSLDTTGEEVVLEKQASAIARGMQSPNPFEETGIRLMAQAASSVNSELGDGTKLRVIIARALIEACRSATAQGVLAHDLLQGIEMGVAASVREIDEAAFKGGEQLAAVARTAAKRTYTDLDIAKIVNSVGRDGYVTVEERDVEGISVHTAENMILERGSIRPEFLTKCPEHKCTLEDCYILLYPGRITALQEIKPILELVAQSGKPLLLVTNELEGEALATILTNYIRGAVRCIPIKSPGAGERRNDLLEDVAALTGATVVSELFGYRLENASLQMLGRASKIIVSLTDTEIVGGAGERATIDHRVAALKALYQSQSDHEIEMTRDRVARMVGTIVTIQVGGASPQERRENKYRIGSAVAAASLAQGKGCVAGGGITLLRASSILSRLKPQTDGQRLGIEALRASLERPFRLLVTSAGIDADEAIKTVKAAGNSRTGYNLETGQKEDLVDAGIIDPAPVLIRGLQIAQGVTRMFLETAAWHVQHG